MKRMTAFLALASLTACAMSENSLPFFDSTTAQSSNNAEPIALAIPQRKDPWFIDGQKKLKEMDQRGLKRQRAKNVILFVGDGMSLATVTAARIHEGQLNQHPGEENKLSFEHFPAVALSKTYNTDFQVPDSAGTATALVAGVKTKMGVIGFDETTTRGECGSGNKVTSILTLAEAAGLSTGIVTTTRLTHATPAVTYAHAQDRNWEADGMAPEGCEDIASQLLGFNHGNGIEVAMGGGRSSFLPKEAIDVENEKKKGRRTDGRDLTKEWLEKHPNSAYVWNADQFKDIAPSKTDHLLALFNPSHMEYELDRSNDKAGEPSLSDMTRKAIAILERNPDGYFLLVESGRIDHAHHETKAQKALVDTIELSNAVTAAMKSVDLDETLIIVTADHSHTMTISGYPVRGNPIRGLAGDQKAGKPILAQDKKPYTTLGYANGPGAIKGARPDPSTDDLMAPNYRQQATYPLYSETHGGDDVPIYAIGPMSDYLEGVVEQNYIFHVMHAAYGFEVK